jgi:hypothetical protein
LFLPQHFGQSMVIVIRHTSRALFSAPLRVLTANPQRQPSVRALNGVKDFGHGLALVLPVEFEAGDPLLQHVEPAVRVCPHRAHARQTHHRTQEYRPPLSKGVHRRVGVGCGHGVVTR